MARKKQSKNEDHTWMLQRLKESQEADHDLREKARDDHAFVNNHKPDGQWEDEWWQAADKKPRYTFDKTTQVINQVCGELYEADFSISVDPAGGEATTKDAQTYEGIVRHIESVSDAKTKVYHQAGRNAVTCGMDAIMIMAQYVDDDCFDQDLTLVHIPNAIDRVWWDANAEEPDASDSRRWWVIQSISDEEYNERWPDGSQRSVSSDRETTSFWQKKEGCILVGEYFYIEEVPRELVLFTNGEVYENNADLQAVIDELAEMGITERRRRQRMKKVVKVRKFDNTDWLEPAEETVFDRVNVLPVYANFKVYENKVLYSGIVAGLKDAQRVLNYSVSREIEEGALAMREKLMMTETQMEGYEEELSTLNTNPYPVQGYNPDPEAQPPFKIGGATINPGLRVISEAMNDMIHHASGQFAANMGENPNAQSGIAIRRLQNKGDTGAYQYTVAMETMLSAAYRVIVGAIPKVYQEERQVRIMNQDGTNEVVTLNTPMMDQETGQPVYLNDLRTGKYNARCVVGPSFRNRQDETKEAILSIGQIDPSAIEMGGDILFNNIPAPGMDDLADRKRMQLFNAGMIPFDQLTDEEKQILQQTQEQQANQEQPADPMMVAAQAEMVKAQTAQAESQGKQQLDQANLQLNQTKLQIAASKEQRENTRLSYEQRNNQFAQNLETQEFQRANAQVMMETLKGHAEILNELKSAIGANVIMSPEALQAYMKQAENVADAVGAEPAMNQPMMIEATPNAN